MKQIPQAFIQASATVSEKKIQVEAKAKIKAEVQDPIKVQARIDMSAEVAGRGLCPECKKPMTRTNSNGIPILSCDEHRIAVPVPDEA